MTRLHRKESASVVDAGEKQNYLQILAIIAGLTVSRLNLSGEIYELENTASLAPVVKFFHSMSMYALYVSMLTALAEVFIAIRYTKIYKLLVPTIYFSIGMVSFMIYSFLLVPMLFFYDPIISFSIASYVAYTTPQTIVLASFFVYLHYIYRRRNLTGAV